jgi:hypothetical protein
MRWLAISTLVAALAAPAPPSSVRVEVLGESFAKGTTARIVATPTEGSDDSTVEHTVALPSETDLFLPAGTAYRIRAEVDGYWAAEAIVEARPEARKPLRFNLVPGGELLGRIVGRDLPIPVAIDLRLTPVGLVAGRSASSVESCPVVKGAFRCVVPAGRSDLRFRLGSSIPIYLWGVDAKPGQRIDLGPLAFASGSSVVGRVDLETGGPLPTGCRIRLGPQVPSNTDRIDTAGRLAGLILEAQPNEQGFFQLKGVSPGSYGLRVEHPNFAPAEVAPVIVRPGLETEITAPLTLHPLSALTVHVVPPLDPFDRPWRLQLNRESIFGVGSFKGVADEMGAWIHSGLPPGRWHLRVLGDQEGIWADQTVEIDGADQIATVEVGAVAVEGVALQGKEPFRGTLWFGGVRGSRRVRFDPDQKGEFVGLLPGEGEWEVHVEDVSSGLDRLTLDPVMVRRRPGRSTAHVEVQVPDTRLEGEVVDESGHGVAATLDLIAGRRPSVARTESDGRFRIRGLPAGMVLVQAETEEQASEPRQVSLEDGRSTPELTLIVRGRTRIRGVVRSARGPLAGAEVFLWPALDQGGMGAMARTVTGPEGSFEIAISAAAPAVDVLASAPGYGISLSRRSVPSEGPLVLDLEAAAGQLDLALAPGEKGSLPRGLLVHRGAFVPAAFLSRWGTLDIETGRLVLPAVEAGDWALCDNLAATRDPAASSPCAQGGLFPGGQLSLRTARTAR